MASRTYQGLRAKGTCKPVLHSSQNSGDFSLLPMPSPSGPFTPRTLVPEQVSSRTGCCPIVCVSQACFGGGKSEFIPHAHYHQSNWATRGRSRKLKWKEYPGSSLNVPPAPQPSHPSALPGLLSTPHPSLEANLKRKGGQV